MKTLPALSFWQPYAWLIVNGHADVDSRTWAPPAHRWGARIGIHASKRKLTRLEFEAFLETVKDLKIKNYPQSPADFDYGMLVGTVVITGVTQKSKSYFAHPGYQHWLLADAEKVSPKPMKGQRGWFTVTL